jgi:hypothetical protein
MADWITVRTILYEPGVFLHYHFASPKGSPYLLLSATYFTGFSWSDQVVEPPAGAIWSLNGGIGYSSFLGRFRIAVELGYRYWLIIPPASDTIIPFHVPIHLALRAGFAL